MKLVAIVGSDGSGKSTQSRLLLQSLSDNGYKAKSVRPVFIIFDQWKDEGSARIGRAVSPRLMALSRAKEGNGRARLRHFAAGVLGYGYATVAYLFLRLQFRRQDYVVCDRYFYQYFFDLFDHRAESISQAFPRPDICIWLDCSPLTLYSRLRQDEGGHESIQYLESVQKFYAKISTGLGFIRVDANGTTARVAGTIWANLKERSSA